MADLLEQMTWAINEGGETKPEVYQFLANIGSAINVTPVRTGTPRPPQGQYAPDLLPLMQQLGWTIGGNRSSASVTTFLKTIAYYLIFTGPNLNPGPYQKPTFPPTPQSIQYMPDLVQFPYLFDIIYWLINDGITGNQKAWVFLESLGKRLNNPPRTTLPGPYRYPTQ